MNTDLATKIIVTSIGAYSPELTTPQKAFQEFSWDGYNMNLLRKLGQYRLGQVWLGRQVASLSQNLK